MSLRRYQVSEEEEERLRRRSYDNLVGYYHRELLMLRRGAKSVELWTKCERSTLLRLGIIVRNVHEKGNRANSAPHRLTTRCLETLRTLGYIRARVTEKPADTTK